jgi:hypothetical protein
VNLTTSLYLLPRLVISEIVTPLHRSLGMQAVWFLPHQVQTLLTLP